MPRFLRKVRQARWIKEQEKLEWLAPGHLPAAPLSDLNTQANELSVWYIPDGGANLEQVIVALASGCQEVTVLDYLLFDPQVLPKLGIEVKKSQGAPWYAAADKWHRDLIELSTSKVVELVKELYKNRKIERTPRVEVLQLLIKAMKAGDLDFNRLPPKMKEQVSAEIE